jgi:ADP-heptose:LPS heptosyltransferase
VKSIAVFRALQLGDMLCAVPALRALRAAHPEARIALIGLPWARELLARFSHYVDEVIEFPGHPGFPERACDAAALPAFMQAVQRRKFELLLQMHGSGRHSNPLAAVLAPGRCAGFYVRGEHCPDPQRFFEWREAEHEVLRWLRLVSLLGIPSCGTALEFPLGEPDWREWRRFGLEGAPYAVVHPGAQLASRRWPPERFGRVADRLAGEGLRIVLTATEAEAALTRAVAAAMKRPALDLAGVTSLGGVGALIARARLLVSNDTGVSHIAAALRTPSVVVCSGADPERWAPLERARHRVLHHPVECRPCAHARCPIGHPCALGVAPERVIDEARELAQCAA